MATVHKISDTNSITTMDVVFIHGLNEVGVLINRKFLSDIATNDNLAFEKLVEVIKAKS